LQQVQAKKVPHEAGTASSSNLNVSDGSELEDFEPPEESRIFYKPPAALPGPSNVMDIFPPEACRVFDKPSANKSRTQVNPTNASTWMPRHTFCS
jgi:hypothetical protein